MKNWIERYLYQIEKRLPHKNRHDLIEEIRANLYDELEATYGSMEPTQDEILAFLQAKGKPETIATSYRGSEQTLISGSLYPIYLLVVKIALFASLLGIAVATIVSVGFETQTPLSALGNFLAGGLQAAIGAVGSVTIIFALIQRFMDPDELKTETEAWNPKDLPAIPEKKNELKRSEPIVAIVFLILLIIGFNFFSDFIAMRYNTASDSVVIPLLNREVLLGYLPWLNLIWGSALVFHVILLIKGQWSTILRIIKIAFDWIGLGVFLWMVSNPNLFAFQGGVFQWIGVEDGATLDNLFGNMARVGIIALILIIVIETGKNIYKIIQK